MTAAEQANFYRGLADHYREKAIDIERTSHILWDVALSLLGAIGESELDGSGINELRELSAKHVSTLYAILKPNGGKL